MSANEDAQRPAARDLDHYNAFRSVLMIRVLQPLQVLPIGPPSRIYSLNHLNIPNQRKFDKITTKPSFAIRKRTSLLGYELLKDSTYLYILLCFFSFNIVDKIIDQALELFSQYKIQSVVIIFMAICIRNLNKHLRKPPHSTRDEVISESAQRTKKYGMSPKQLQQQKFMKAKCCD